jgi:hypothetical protein
MPDAIASVDGTITQAFDPRQMQLGVKLLR